MVAMVRAGALTGFARLLDDYGVRLSAVLGTLGLPDDYLDQVEHLIPLDTKIQLLETAATLTRCQHFGLELARHQSIATLGLVGMLIQHSATVREALDTISGSIDQHVQLLTARLEERDDMAYFSFSYDRPGERERPSRQHIDNTAVTGVNILRSLLEAPLRLRAVYLAGDEPASLEPYNAVFHAPLVFNHRENVLVFDRSLLDQPVIGADPTLRGILSGFIRKKHLDEFQGRLVWVITNLLPTGQVTLNEVAEAMRMAPRTLQHRLSRHGMTYQQLLDQVRVDQACNYMLKGSYSLADVADLVGYSHISALNRSFKRIMGVSPAAWRRRQSPGSDRGIARSGNF